jgi:MFS family permease
VQGFSYAFIGTASIILAALTISSLERDKGVGIYTAFLSLGLLTGPLITTFSIPFFGVSNTFFFAALAGLVGIYAAYILNRKFSEIEKNWQVIGVRVEKELFKNKILAIIRNRTFATAFIGNLSFFILFGVLLAYAPLYAKGSLKFSDELVSMVFLLYYVATTLTRLNVGKIVQKVGKDKLLLVGTGLSVLLAFSLAYFKNGYVFAAFFAMIGAVQGILFPVGSMLIAERIHPSRNVLANSLYMMGADTGQGIAPLITVGIAIQYGMAYTFIASAVISTFATIAILLISRLNQKS